MRKGSPTSPEPFAHCSNQEYAEWELLLCVPTGDQTNADVDRASRRAAAADPRVELVRYSMSDDGVDALEVGLRRARGDFGVVMGFVRSHTASCSPPRRPRSGRASGCRSCTRTTTDSIPGGFDRIMRSSRTGALPCSARRTTFVVSAPFASTMPGWSVVFESALGLIRTGTSIFG